MNGPPVVAPPGPAEAWDGRRLRHEATFCAGVEQKLDRCLPFVTDGLAAGQPVMVVASDALCGELRRALGDATGRLVRLDDAAGRGPGSHRTILGWDRDLSQLAQPGGPLRVVTEPVWLAGAGGLDWHRFESLANRMYASLPLYIMCVHDSDALAGDVLALARRTHPWIWRGSRCQPSEAYLPPEEFIPTQELPWTPVPGGARVASVPSARDAWMEAGRGAAPYLDRAQLESVTVAAAELTANAMDLRADVTVLTWAEDDRFYLQVSDDGPGGIDPLAGYAPPRRGDHAGWGLWLVRALADDSATRSRASGSDVRLAFRIPGGYL